MLRSPRLLAAVPAEPLADLFRAWEAATRAVAATQGLPVAEVDIEAEVGHGGGTGEEGVSYSPGVSRASQSGNAEDRSAATTATP